MAQKTMVDGTAYEVKGGKDLVDGTQYSIRSGKAMVNGTGYDIPFGEKTVTITFTSENNNTWSITINGVIYNASTWGFAGTFVFPVGSTVVMSCGGYSGGAYWSSAIIIDGSRKTWQMAGNFKSSYTLEDLQVDLTIAVRRNYTYGNTTYGMAIVCTSADGRYA